MADTFTLIFCGGARSVTGANYLLHGAAGGGPRILVDCGLSQGERFANEKNREPFSYDPSSVSHLLVTHAHIDHIGRIPKLVREGFRGEILSTEPTRALAEPMLSDALRILEEESRQNGVLPFYAKDDIARALGLWRSIPYHEERAVTSDFSIYLRDAGHVLGSAIIEVRHGGKKIVFTGDLGNSPTPILRNAEVVSDAEYLVMESVYGDRNHENAATRRERLAGIIRDVAKRGGTLLLPLFSLEKTQVILHEMNDLLGSGAIPSVPVFLDSPLAISITDIYRRMSRYFNDASRREVSGGDDIFQFPKLITTRTPEDSARIRSIAGPKIIIAGSGMSTGGRIIEHEWRLLGDPTTTILFVGYQSAGSLGREIEEGMKRVMIEGRQIRVRARVESVGGYSSHMDSEHLLSFAAGSAATLRRVFVVMGEPRASFFLAQRIHDYLGLSALVPEEGESVEIEL